MRKKWLKWPKWRLCGCLDWRGVSAAKAENGENNESGYQWRKLAKWPVSVCSHPGAVYRLISMRLWRLVISLVAARRGVKRTQWRNG
jgi:hypothetical protein